MLTSTAGASRSSTLTFESEKSGGPESKKMSKKCQISQLDEFRRFLRLVAAILGPDQVVRAANLHCCASAKPSRLPSPVAVSWQFFHGKLGKDRKRSLKNLHKDLLNRFIACRCCSKNYDFHQCLKAFSAMAGVPLLSCVRGSSLLGEFVATRQVVPSLVAGTQLLEFSSPQVTVGHVGHQ